ncbi:helix-turn-helix domain-containing protein [Mycolicibacterium canariasense]|uniref:helix-turn-helix domain-containing protein n=1 Tax=Mycolicibacterium canariasense TaxID=228230 RepID=UPI003908B65A
MRNVELGAFLQARRAAVSPTAVGLPPSGARRRVPGLRREEVAALVGLSTDYYIRLEQGRAGRHRRRCSRPSRGRCYSTSPSVNIFATSPARVTIGPAQLVNNSAL